MGCPGAERGCAGRDPSAGAVGGDAGNAALQTDRRRTGHHEAEVDVAGAIRGDGRVDVDVAVVDGR